MSLPKALPDRFSRIQLRHLFVQRRVAHLPVALKHDGRLPATDSLQVERRHPRFKRPRRELVPGAMESDGLLDPCAT